jgi:hypothetical protein
MRTSTSGVCGAGSGASTTARTRGSRAAGALIGEDIGGTPGMAASHRLTWVHETRQARSMELRDTPALTAATT